MSVYMCECICFEVYLDTYTYTQNIDFEEMREEIRRISSGYLKSVFFSLE